MKNKVRMNVKPVGDRYIFSTLEDNNYKGLHFGVDSLDKNSFDTACKALNSHVGAIKGSRIMCKTSTKFDVELSAYEFDIFEF